MVNQQRLEEIFERPFRDEGENYRALCPIHDEKTPSFYVGKDNHLVHCFGCGTKGDIISFVKKYKGVDETEALKLLGLSIEKLLNIDFQQICPPKPETYPESWLAPFRKEIHKYVIRRGFRSDTLRSTDTRYDHSSQRQVFPHRRRDGQLVGAIGRACKEQEPKWWFYWGYEKGRYLYRTPSILESSRRNSEQKVDERSWIWVVEGVFDAVWLYQHGYNAVALLGSKATRRQIEEIKDNYDSIILALDNDEAGILGTAFLWKQLRNSCEIYMPSWPAKANDIMDTNPKDLDLINVVERALISSSN